MDTFTTILIVGEWELIQANVLKNRKEFDKEIFNLIRSSIKTIIKNYKYVSIILPSYVTTAERHCLHKYTIKNYIEPISIGSGEGRTMTINLSLEYIKDIYDDYYEEEIILYEATPKITTEEPAQLSELEIFKKKLRQDLMDFIELHL